MNTKFKLPPINKERIHGKFLIISGLLLTLLLLLSSSALAQEDVLTAPARNYETVQGWYQGRATFYYEFGTNSPATEDRSEVVPAPIYALVTGFDEEGNPIPVEGQNNIVDVIPGDEGYSDLWEVTFVTVPEDYEANSITSAQELIDAGYEQTVPGVYVNCPIVPAGSTLAEGGSELVQGWYKGQEVFYFSFDQPTVQTAPIYAFITGFNENDEPIFVEGQQNIIDVIPGDEGYSAFWDVQLVVVPEDYEANSITSAEEVMASGYDIMPANLLVNCPVIRTEAAAMSAEEEAPADEVADEDAAMAEEMAGETTEETMEETIEETTDEAPAMAEETAEEAPTTTEETPADLPATGGPGSSFPLWLAVLAGGLLLLGIGFVLRSTVVNKA